MLLHVNEEMLGSESTQGCLVLSYQPCCLLQLHFSTCSFKSYVFVNIIILHNGWTILRQCHWLTLWSVTDWMRLSILSKTYWLQVMTLHRVINLVARERRRTRQCWLLVATSTWVVLQRVVRWLSHRDPIGNDLNPCIWEWRPRFLHTAIIDMIHLIRRLVVFVRIRILQTALFEWLSIWVLCSVCWIAFEESTFCRESPLRWVIRCRLF